MLAVLQRLGQVRRQHQAVVDERGEHCLHRSEQLDVWIERIQAALAANPGSAPFGVNLIVHKSNTRQQEDLAACVRHQVPLIITSVGEPSSVVAAIHSYGGLLNPFALVSELREFYPGPIILSGSLTRGNHIRAAEIMGADFAYMGTRLIATQEAHAEPGYKQMIVDSNAADIVYTPAFTGIHGNYLKGSIVASGLDPDNIVGGKSNPDTTFNTTAPRQESESKAWRDIWGAGQGVGSIHDVPTVAELVPRLQQEYNAACH